MRPNSGIEAMIEIYTLFETLVRLACCGIRIEAQCEPIMIVWIFKLEVVKLVVISLCGMRTLGDHLESLILYLDCTELTWRGDLVMNDSFLAPHPVFFTCYGDNVIADIEPECASDLSQVDIETFYRSLQ